MHLLSETPFLFFGIVLAIGLVFKVAIGWAKTPTTLSEDPAAGPLTSSATATPAAGPAVTATATPTVPALATAEPVPTVPAPSMLPRKRPRPRR